MLKNFSFAPKVIQDVGTGKGTGWYTSTGTTVIDENGNVVGAVVPGDIALPSAQILVGNASGKAAPVTMSGNATISNTGAVNVTGLVDSNGNTAVAIGAAASAVNYLTVVDGATANPVTLEAAGSDTNISLVLLSKGNGYITFGPSTASGFVIQGTTPLPLLDAAGNTLIAFVRTTSAVNGLQVANAATGTAPVLGAIGSDTNIGLKLSPKGTGIISLEGTGAKTSSQVFNYIATETGANNAIAGALVDCNGTAVPLAAGLRVIVKLAHTLQAGANTFALNGGSTKSILSHLNTSNNIGTAYAATGVIDMLYDGTEWLDMSQ